MNASHVKERVWFRSGRQGMTDGIGDRENDSERGREREREKERAGKEMTKRQDSNGLSDRQKGIDERKPQGMEVLRVVFVCVFCVGVVFCQASVLGRGFKIGARTLQTVRNVRAQTKARPAF